MVTRRKSPTKKRAPKKSSARVTRVPRVSLRALRAVLSTSEIATRLGVSVATVERWVRVGAPASRQSELSSILISDQERIRAKAQEIAGNARKTKRIKPPGDAPEFNKTGKQETRRYRGVVSNTRLAKKGAVIDRRSEESIVHAIMEKAKKIARKQKRGRFFVTLGLVEFGVTVGSGGKKLVTVTKGKLGGMAGYQTFASTDPDYGQDERRGALGLDGLEAQVRHLVERLSGEPRHAAILDNFTVKRYVQKTEKEVSQWRTRGKR